MFTRRARSDGRAQSPLWGLGAPAAVLAPAKSASGRKQAAQHGREPVLHKTSAPDGKRRRPGLGSAPGEPGAALARLRDAVNTRRRCKRRDRRSGVGRRPSLATKEEGPRGYRRPLQRQLSGAGKGSGSSGQAEISFPASSGHRARHARSR